MAEAQGIEDEISQILYSFALFHQARNEMIKRMKNREWLHGAVIDFREKFGINLLDPDIDYVEAYFLSQGLESSPDSHVGAISKKQGTLWDSHLIMLGEILRSVVYSNQKKKKEIRFPWDKKEEPQKLQAAVISKEDAAAIFSNMRKTRHYQQGGNVLN